MPPPPLTPRTSDRPGTPTRNSFITPVSTPQGSPSKKQQPPGAIDLPYAFENALKLNSAAPASPTRGSVPLSPTKTNTLAIDDSYFGNSSGGADESIIHKAGPTPGSPLRRQQGKENTPPGSRHGEPNQAAVARHELYQSRDQPQWTTRKYNTQRGLTAEELEILQKPNVKRLANVTQLCTHHDPLFFWHITDNC